MLDYLEKLIDELKNKKPYDKNNRVFELLSDESTNPTRMIMIGSELYRARKIEGSEPTNISKGFYGYDARGSFVNPNPQNISAMRANREGQARLYCADVNYLSLIEVRPELGKQISLSTIKVNSILKILDLTNFHIGIELSEEKRLLMQELSYLFSLPVNKGDNEEDYFITQVIADFVEKLGYDGIAYSSSLSPRLNQENYNCANLVIFNYKHCVPIKSNVIEMTSKCHQDSTDYDYTNFEQCDNDSDRINLISYKEESYDFHFTFGPNAVKVSNHPVGLNKNVFVSAGNIIFNQPIKMLGYDSKIDILIGNGINIVVSLNKGPTSISFSMPDTLNERINNMIVLFACLEQGKIWLGDRKNPRMGSYDISKVKEEYGNDLYKYEKELIFDKELKDILLSMNLYFDIDIKNIKNVDKSNILMLRDCVVNHKILYSNIKFQRFQIIDIQGHKVYLIFDKISNNKYIVSDFFQNIVGISCDFNNIPILTSQFSLLGPEEMITIENISFDIIVSSYKKLYDIKSNYYLPHSVNEDLYNAIKAYDFSKDSKFLHFAESINNWIESVPHTYVKDSHLSFVNHCQILKRKGVLGDCEINRLKSIIKETKVDTSIILMIYILLDERSKIKNTYEKLSDQEKALFSNLPIINLCPNIM